MKKLKFILSALIRIIFILVPGALYGWWAWDKAPALISIPAAVGVELVFMALLSFILIAVQAVRDMKNEKPEESTEAL